MEKFNSAYYVANLLYDIELSPDQFVELALIAWSKIGNKQTRLYRYDAAIDAETRTVKIPCNCDFIEAVAYDFEDWNYVSKTTLNGDYSSLFAENYIELRKMYSNPLYLPGKYAKFTQDDEYLYFDKNYGGVRILYKGVVVDEEGLPFINEKEKQAIACYCAFTIKYKEGLRSNNSGIIQIAQLLRQDWLRLCDAARVPERLTQNEMNEILDGNATMNRKLFNKSYKPIQ